MKHNIENYENMTLEEKLAQLRGRSVEEVQRITMENGKNLYRI